MIDLLTQLPTGPVLRCDLIDLMAERVRSIDPREFQHGFRRLDNAWLRCAEGPTKDIDRLLKHVPKRYADVFRWLRVDERTLAIPVGFDQLAMFCMLFNFDSGPV